MNVEELRTRYQGLAVAACEWRAMGLADPVEMGAQVFRHLGHGPDFGLKELYRAIDKVVMASYQNYSDATSILDRLRGGMVITGPRGRRTAAEDFLDALSRLRESDRVLIQMRFWDELDDAEAGEVLGLPVEGVRERLARAGTRYLSKLGRTHPDLVLTDVEDTIRSIKPGVHRRFLGRGEG